MAFSRRHLLKLGLLAMGGVAGCAPADVQQRQAVAVRLARKLEGAASAYSVCPYCSVGCGQRVATRGGRLVNVEGEPRHPVSEGALCARGSATFQHLTSPYRLTRVLYRPPRGRAWEARPLDWAMDRIAERFVATRDATYVAPPDLSANHTPAIAALLGGMLDNEEIYLLVKLLRAAGISRLDTAARLGHAASPPALAATFGWPAATNPVRDLANSDCIVIAGSNMAETHPVAFRWVLAARQRGAKVVHVDPRATRTTLHADLHVAPRPGTDVAFLGGLINLVLAAPRFGQDDFFKEYLATFTNAATLVARDFRDTEEMAGLFSGFDSQRARYDPATWDYQRSASAPPAPAGGTGMPARVPLPRPSPAASDPTLANPRCVFQVLRRHFLRYTPEMVEVITGVQRAQLTALAEMLLANSGRERTTAFVYSAGLAQHNGGTQAIRAAAILQGLLGNVGRPGGGLLPLYGQANTQGALDLGAAAGWLPGYLPLPRGDQRSLDEYLRGAGTRGFLPPEGLLAARPAHLVSLLKAWFGAQARAGNDFGYLNLPRVTDDVSQAALWQAAAKGAIRGLLVLGQNPAVNAPHATAAREGLRRLEWLVVRDTFETETAAAWTADPTSSTEVFLLPAALTAEKEGSLTCLGRLIQWHEQAAQPPGDARSELWFADQLFRRLRAAYASHATPRETGLLSLQWDYGDPPEARRVLHEINGYRVEAGTPLASLDQLRDDGSTACGSWITAGVAPAPDRNLAARRAIDAQPTSADPLLAHLASPISHWGWAWPGDRQYLHSRASADAVGQPWSARKRLISWDQVERRWTGLDAPDGVVDRPPVQPAAPERPGLAGMSGQAAFLLHGDGRLWLFAPGGALADGPLPAHYEPVESPVANALYPQQANPATLLRLPPHQLARMADPRFPVVLTTVRIAEQQLTGGASRWLGWLAELAPWPYVEIGEALALARGIRFGQRVVLRTARGEVHALAVVTAQLGWWAVSGRQVHLAALPWHWAERGLARGTPANLLTAAEGDPNSDSPDVKALLCDVQPFGGLRG